MEKAIAVRGRNGNVRYDIVDVTVLMLQWLRIPPASEKDGYDRLGEQKSVAVSSYGQPASPPSLFQYICIFSLSLSLKPHFAVPRVYPSSPLFRCYTLPHKDFL